MERKKYQNQMYLGRKYPDKTEKEIFSLELQERIRRDQNLLKRHEYFMQQEFRRTPGLWTLFSDLSVRNRNKILKPIKKRAFRALADYERRRKIAERYQAETDGEGVSFDFRKIDKMEEEYFKPKKKRVSVEKTLSNIVEK
jgi:hypothetical protein